MTTGRINQVCVELLGWRAESRSIDRGFLLCARGLGPTNPTDAIKVLIEDTASNTFSANAPLLITEPTLRIAGKMVEITAPHRLAFSDEALAGAMSLVNFSQWVEAIRHR